MNALHMGFEKLLSNVSGIVQLAVIVGTMLWGIAGLKTDIAVMQHDISALSENYRDLKAQFHDYVKENKTP